MVEAVTLRVVEAVRPLHTRCYIVEHGKFVVKVTKDDGSTHDVSAIGPGGCFGEMSLLYSAKRTASVAAQGRSSVWAMHREVPRGQTPLGCACARTCICA